MKDIIASQHVERRSGPSLLSTALKYKAAPVPSFQNNSFIADQVLPKRKKKRISEKTRSSVNLNGFGNIKQSPKENSLFSWRNLCHILKSARLRTKLKAVGAADFFENRTEKEKPASSFSFTPVLAVRDIFSGKLLASGRNIFTGNFLPSGRQLLSAAARLPRKLFLIVLLCLTVGSFALMFNYIPEPEPPEDMTIREHGSKSGAVFESDEIPLDLTETFAWQSYKVRSGDSVEAIARRFGLSIDAIIASNDLRNVRRLRSGEKIRIPNMDGIPYKVKSGDTYSKIASSFGVSLEAILDANDIQSDAIAMDAVLFIPGARMDRNALREALGEFFVWPISGKINSGFGWRNDPFSGIRSFHAGLDISGNIGQSVKAATDGKVSAIGYNSVYGNFVIITHSPEYQTMYAHLHKILVKNGAYVSQGTIIGQVGTTGRSTGPHLHFSVYKNSRAVSPLEVLNK